jgi:hypothetical protein
MSRLNGRLPSKFLSDSCRRMKDYVCQWCHAARKSEAYQQTLVAVFADVQKEKKIRDFVVRGAGDLSPSDLIGEKAKKAYLERLVTPRMRPRGVALARPTLLLR